MNILVTDGHSRAALAIVRSLGAKGHRLYVGSSRKSSLASSSRFCHSAVQYADPSKDEMAFLATLVELVNFNHIEMVIPVTDVCVLPISANRTLFPKACVIPLAPEESLIYAADKSHIMETSKRLGIATPKSVLITSLDDFHNKNVEIEYPVVIKPSRSRVQIDGGWVSTNVDYANNKQELLHLVQSLTPGTFPVLLQERISGPGIGLFYCFDNGNPVATFAHKRLREKPPSGGVSVLRESVLPHKVANEYGIALLRELSWRGVAMVEFKLDDRDGIPKLMEINGRFWGSLQLAIDAGVDFPSLLLSVFGKNPPQQNLGYEVGIRSRWIWGEIDVFLMYLLKSKKTLKLSANSESRFISAFKAITPWIPRQRLEVLRLSDIRPWVYETLARLKD